MARCARGFSLQGLKKSLRGLVFLHRPEMHSITPKPFTATLDNVTWYNGLVSELRRECRTQRTFPRRRIEMNALPLDSGLVWIQSVDSGVVSGRLLKNAIWDENRNGPFDSLFALSVS